MSEMFAEILPLTATDSWVETKRRGRGVQKIEHVTKIFSNDLIKVEDHGVGKSSSAYIKSEYIEKVKKAFCRKYPQYKGYIKDDSCFYSAGARIASGIGVHVSTFDRRDLVTAWVETVSKALKTTKDGVEAIYRTIIEEEQEEHDHKIRDVVSTLKALSDEDLKEVLARLNA